MDEVSSPPLVTGLRLEHLTPFAPSTNEDGCVMPFNDKVLLQDITCFSLDYDANVFCLGFASYRGVCAIGIKSSYSSSR